jgi:hypothetical protein
MTEKRETTSLLTSVTENIDDISAPRSVTETGPLDFAPITKLENIIAAENYSGGI